VETKRIKYVYVGSQDVGKLGAFYSQSLGISEAFTDGKRWQQFSINGSNFAVASPEESAVLPGQGFVPVFEVDDLKSATERVRQAGGTVVSTRDMGAHGIVTTLQDPEGNTFQLFASADASIANISRA
jgi:predicted enzyme related to lactoylglutathione lyase